MVLKHFLLLGVRIPNFNLLQRISQEWSPFSKHAIFHPNIFLLLLDSALTGLKERESEKANFSVISQVVFYKLLHNICRMFCLLSRVALKFYQRWTENAPCWIRPSEMWGGCLTSCIQYCWKALNLLVKLPFKEIHKSNSLCKKWKTSPTYIMYFVDSKMPSLAVGTLMNLLGKGSWQLQF